MGPVRVGVADSLDDGHLALVVERLQRGHGRVESNLVVDPQDLLFVHPYHRPVVGIERVAVRDDGIDCVVSPGELKHHQHRVFLG